MTTEASDAGQGRLLKRYCPLCGHPLQNRYWEGAVRPFCRLCDQPLYENPIPAVCTVVPDDRGQLLLVRRGVEPRRGEWCLPGGFMELGEAPESAALRELQEETGLRGRVVELLGLRSTPSRIYHTILIAAYVVMPDGGRPRAGDDAVEVGWFRSDDLPAIAFDSHRAFIHDYRARGFENRASGIP